MRIIDILVWTTSLLTQYVSREVKILKTDYFIELEVLKHSENNIWLIVLKHSEKYQFLNLFLKKKEQWKYYSLILFWKNQNS